MSAQRHRHAHRDQDKNERSSSGVFELPASARVVRRGSTRVEPAPTDSVLPRGRGRSFRADD
jgi:hypothetical protein